MTDIDPLLGRRPLPPPTAATVRRPTPTPRSRRAHPALGARIVAAGLGASTMFGLVAAMGAATIGADGDGSSPNAQAAPAIPSSAIVGPSDAVATPRPDVRLVTPGATETATRLTPRPAPAPRATTRGSG